MTLPPPPVSSLSTLTCLPHAWLAPSPPAPSSSSRGAQVHDEVILEGPEEHAQEAKRLVQAHMGNPWASIMAERRRQAGKAPWPLDRMPLRVELATDCDAAPTWYEAK